MNESTITLERQDWEVPAVLHADGRELVPFAAGKSLPWMLVEG